jgi:hypothetical protein
MSDQSTLDSTFDPALVAALDDLAAAVRFPATPPIAVGIVSQLEVPSRAGWGISLPSWRRALVLGTLAALLVAGVAGAIGLGTGAIQIRFADGTPLPTPVGSVPNRGFGQPSSLAEAGRTVPFAIRVPTEAELGPPDAVFLAPLPEGGTVTLAWTDRASWPAHTDRLGLVVTQFSADLGPETFEKMTTEGTRVQTVEVNGEPGWWVEGGIHAFFYRDATGEIVDTTIRLVGSALLWEEDGVTYRIEGAPDLPSALRVATSLR